nr:uncharacterized protein LOC111504647 [Leptinotarsa decemlineata]
MQPPPPPPPLFLTHKNSHGLRKNVLPPRQSLDDVPIAEDRIMNEGPRKPILGQDPFGFYKGPPQVRIANRRNGDDDVEVETLQMIQSKKVEKLEDGGLVTEVVQVCAGQPLASKAPIHYDTVCFFLGEDERKIIQLCSLFQPLKIYYYPQTIGYDVPEWSGW